MGERQLILLSGDVENPQDLQIAAGAICFFVDTYKATVWSCLAKDSVEVLIEARRMKGFEAGLYANLNPLRSAEMIWKHQIQSDQDALSLCEQLKIAYCRVENPPDEENEDQYKERIVGCATNLGPGCNLVIVPFCVIETLFQSLQGTGTPGICSLWNLDPNPAVASFADSFETLMTQLNLVIEPPKPPAEEEPPKPLAETEPPKPLAQAESIQPARYGAHEPPQAKEEGKESQKVDSHQEMRLKAIEEWKLVVEGSLRNLTEEIERKNKEVEAWKDTANQQKDQLEALERRVADLEASVDGVKTNTDRQIRDLNEQQGRNAIDASVEQEKRIAGINDKYQKLSEIVEGLKADLQARQPAASPLPREREEGKAAEVAKEAEPEVQQMGTGMLVTIQTAGLKENGRWYATVAAYQPISGYLGVYQQDELKFWTSAPVNFSSVPMEIDLSALWTPQPGQHYQLSVLIEGQKVSNEYNLDIPSIPQRNFEDTFICKYCGNVREIEAYLRESFGEGMVDLFKRLAIEWSNESYDQVGTFAAVICQGSYDEGVIRARLAAAGIQLNS